MKKISLFVFLACMILSACAIEKNSNTVYASFESPENAYYDSLVLDSAFLKQKHPRYEKGNRPHNYFVVKKFQKTKKP